MKLKTLIFGPLMFCILWFLGWESYAIYTARGKTEEIFAPYQNEHSLAVAWADLTREHRNILLTVEDPRFFEHHGVDLRTPGAGITSITQAIAKRLYFEKFTPGFAKIEQTLIALFVIDPVVPKTVQMNTFLNIAYFGSRQGEEITGFDAAARWYFSKPADGLSSFEFTQLVAALVGPNAYAPGTDANLKRTSKIQALLAGKCAPVSNRDVLYERC